MTGIADAISKAITAGTKKWAKQRKAEERRESAASNRRARLVPSYRVTIKDAAWKYMERAYLAASANGTLPAHARQIMYQARPLIQAVTDKPLDDQYFCQNLLPDYIEEEGVDWDVVWDDRGHFEEPFTERRIGLGTLSVRNYIGNIDDPSWIEPEITTGAIATYGPAGRYGAVLFVEKEGFLPLFRAVQLAERFDVAIMSTKGVSNTAARTLVDELGGEGVPLLVLHDFDKAGFSIFGTLCRDTRRYTFANDVEVIDLGLRLADVRDLGLTPEQAFDRGSKAARSWNLSENGATQEEISFLLNQRVELNALTSDQMIAFIERKLTEHGVAKVIPDADLLAESYRNKVISARIEKVLEEALAQQEEGDQAIEVPADLAVKVADYLKNNPAEPWDRAVARIAASEIGDEVAP